jgi:tetraacyldisaccharide 4'-kinase
MQRRLTELWYRPDPGPSALQPFAWLYAALLRVRRRAYAAGWKHSIAVGVPVVVIGNLTVGGTGKTPLTVWLAQRLTERGFEVGVVSRGYGRRGGGAPTEVRGDSDWREVGDEPLLIARRTGCATVVSADRAAGARLLAARGAQVILADDGLQHLRLARVCEVLVVDGARGFGNGRVLPAGPLREALAPPLQADAVVVNGAAEHGSLAGVLPATALTMQLAVQEARSVADEPPRPLDAWRGQRVHGVAGIGNPGRFFAELRAHGIEVIEHPFADHHAFRAADLEFGDGLPVLMTEKDAVKCGEFADARLWFVPVSARFSDADARQLLSRVLARVAPPPAARGDD